MPKRILINASHQEETRVVVLSGNRIEEFDYENKARSQLKGNIYLAKITRVEPSLQAAFVEYGGNRHGFLPFSEIHSDYYRIPVADREALAAEEAALRGNGLGEEDEEQDAGERGTDGSEGGGEAPPGLETGPDKQPRNGQDGPPAAKAEGEDEQLEPDVRVDTLGGDEVEDDQRRRARLLRRYKIQEVIKRRQIILVQVSKEERGTKGAALTTYLSLAGRYCVLMPNTARGGGISRKISSANDRRRLKKILTELEIPEGVAVIVRTAGSQRSKAEIRRDYEYLLRLWSDIRDKTLKSTAPCLIHEEANLIKRSIRDLYARDMEDVLVEGEAGYKAAKEFMRALIPSHAKKVQQYKDPTTPLFHHFKIENQLDAIHSPTVQLKAGGYIVLNQTEALVAIDVNSGKATKERHIEETALKTNLEAADEVARQLRLRDLAGLIVIDFIDMEEPRHNREVERRLKEAMRTDRARIQLGRISPFGLLELSRQRLRPSLVESSSDLCPRCGGTGHVRSIDSSAINVLRVLEEEGLRSRDVELRVSVPTPIALHLLNQLRDRLVEVEQRYGFKVHIQTDDELIAPGYRLERLTDGAVVQQEDAAEDDGGRKRRRRSRRRRDEEDDGAARRESAASPPEAEVEQAETREVAAGEDEESETDERGKTRRRRGKRGGRKRARRRVDAAEPERRVDAAEPERRVDAAEPERRADATEPESPAADADATGEATPGEAEPAPRPKRTRGRRRPAARVAARAAADETAAQETAAQETAAQETTAQETAAVTAPRDAPPKAGRSPRRRPSRRAAKTPPAEAEPLPQPPFPPAEPGPLPFPPVETGPPPFPPADLETTYSGDAVAEAAQPGGPAPGAVASPEDGEDASAQPDGEPASVVASADEPALPEEGPPAVAASPEDGAEEPGESEAEPPFATIRPEEDGAAPDDEADRPKRRGWWQRLV